MSECPMQASVERNTSDIKTLTASVTELVSTVRVLAEGQKHLGELVRSQVEHNLEITTIKQTLRDVRDTQSDYARRLQAVEEYKLATLAANEARHGLLTACVKYGPIVLTVLFGLITIGILIKEISL